MKKVLLLSLAVLLTGSSVAQTLGKRNMPAKSRTHVVNKGQMQTYVNKPVSAGVGQFVKKSMPVVNLVKLTATHHVDAVNTSRRAAAMQASYTGTGRNYETHENASWTMKVASTDKASYLIDMIPLPEEWSSLEEIAVECTVSGNTVKVAPQCVVSGQSQTGQTLYYFIHSWTSEDGSIVLTLDEDGYLTTIDGEDIAYSAFSENVFDLSKGGPYLGLVMDIENVKYYAENQEIVPVAGYEPESFFLHPGCNVNGNYYANVLIPAFANISLKNRSDMGTSFAWSIQPVDYDEANKVWVNDGSPITSNSEDFVFSVTNKTYNPATLVASFNAKSSDPFQWNKAQWYAGGAASDWEDGTSPTLTFMKGNPAGDLTLLNPAGVSGMIYYQGKPDAPLFFTGINFGIYDFAVADGKTLKMSAKICKAHRDENGKFSLGEVIAQSDCDQEVETGSLFTRVNFNNFYTEDEFGMTSELDYLIVDEEFAVVIDGWDNETFTGRPLAVEPTVAGGYSSTFAILPGKTTYTGAGWSFTGNCVVGFTGAVYGYLHTENPTDLVIPAEGGTVRIDNINPMYCTSDDNNNPTTMLWLENEDSAPDWVTVNIANEAYTDTDWFFDLSFTAEALPEGVSGRTGELVFAQKGALLKVTISQGETSGVQTVVNSSKAANGNMFDLSGRQVSGKKGLVVRDGKKFIVK